MDRDRSRGESRYRTRRYYDTSGGIESTEIRRGRANRDHDDHDGSRSVPAGTFSTWNAPRRSRERSAAWVEHLKTRNRVFRSLSRLASLYRASSILENQIARPSVACSPPTRVAKLARAVFLFFSFDFLSGDARSERVPLLPTVSQDSFVLVDRFSSRSVLISVFTWSRGAWYADEQRLEGGCC